MFALLLIVNELFSTFLTYSGASRYIERNKFPTASVTLSLCGSNWLTTPVSEWYSENARKCRELTDEIDLNRSKVENLQNKAAKEERAAEQDKNEVADLEKEQETLVKTHQERIQIFEKLEADVAIVRKKANMGDAELNKQKEFAAKLKAKGMKKMNEVDQLKVEIATYEKQMQKRLQLKKEHVGRLMDALQTH
ncbi:uncharacterized protein [Antedon mediterranea]|uniref:uncharacterized protein n=1 Tax=Antedon mediterranea TaxID=105859 RepID=UPI003AF6F08A